MKWREKNGEQLRGRTDDKMMKQKRAGSGVGWGAEMKSTKVV